MTLPLLFFLLIGAVCLAAAAGVVLSKEPVHSALFLLANFATLAVLYITLDAQFLAAVQVIVYAGGIVILILFVIMLIGGETTDTVAPHRNWSRYVALLLGITLLGGLGYTIAQRVSQVPALDSANAAIAGGVPRVLGAELFTEYVLPFELVAILLLVALLGALVMGRDQDPVPPTHLPNTRTNSIPGPVSTPNQQKEA